MFNFQVHRCDHEVIDIELHGLRVILGNERLREIGLPVHIHTIDAIVTINEILRLIDRVEHLFDQRLLVQRKGFPLRVP